jgi:DNA-binding Xre family transcriptional regulator
MHIDYMRTIRIYPKTNRRKKKMTITPKKEFPESNRIAARLAAARGAARMSQSDLSKMSGLTQSQISRYEACACPISIDTLFIVCNALGQVPSEVIADDFSVQI